jgi:hypothetical protein
MTGVAGLDLAADARLARHWVAKRIHVTFFVASDADITTDWRTNAWAEGRVGADPATFSATCGVTAVATNTVAIIARELGRSKRRHDAIAIHRIAGGPSFAEGKVVAHATRQSGLARDRMGGIAQGVVGCGPGGAVAVTEPL